MLVNKNRDVPGKVIQPLSLPAAFNLTAGSLGLLHPDPKMGSTSHPQTMNSFIVREPGSEWRHAGDTWRGEHPLFFIGTSSFSQTLHAISLPCFHLSFHKLQHCSATSQFSIVKKTSQRSEKCQALAASMRAFKGLSCLSVLIFSSPNTWHFFQHVPISLNY